LAANAEPYYRFLPSPRVLLDAPASDSWLLLIPRPISLRQPKRKQPDLRDRLLDISCFLNGLCNPISLLDRSYRLRFPPAPWQSIARKTSTQAALLSTLRLRV